MNKYLYITLILLLLSSSCAAQISYYESTDYSSGVGESDKAFIEINEKYSNAIFRFRFDYNHITYSILHKVNYVQFNCHTLRKDSLLVFILGNFQYESKEGQFIEPYADFYNDQKELLCPYIVGIQQNDSIIIQYISNNLVSFLEINEIIEKNECIIGNIFPGVYTRANELPKDFLPKKLYEGNNYKKEVKRIKKKLLLGHRCVNL